MHTTPNDSLELHTLRSQLERDRLRLELTMVRVQIAALETLERFMEDPKPTGDEKKDKAEAIARNRKRLAATQALLHCRTAEREQRLAKANRNSINKQQRLEPNRASDGSQASGEEMLPTPFRASSPAPSPATDNQSGEGGRRSQSVGRMRGRPEPSETSECGMLKQRLSMSPQDSEVHAQTSLSMPHERDPRSDIANDPLKGAAAQAESTGHADLSANTNPPPPKPFPTPVGRTIASQIIALAGSTRV